MAGVANVPDVLEDGKCGETTISDFVFFMSGSRSTVPGGYQSPLTVVFVDTPEKPLPRVSTCALRMQVSAPHVKN
ncbi:hypothetical protein V1264_021609 [Littorina saxatilis]|uniref:Uncharacterized protein n=1 Tax=Littorina saxatilis TaxID=31220 RepID=A0AAN9AIK6_9CAEN